MTFNEEIPYNISTDNPDNKYKLDLWQTAFGLQRTDNLTPSEYMVQQAQDHIDGKSDYHVIEQNIKSYYAESKADERSRTEEADISALRIAQILSEEGFTLSPVTLKSYHKR